MPYNAKVYRILIASPGDVEKERNLASNIIYDWNCIHSEAHEIVLIPVRWETHSSPDVGRAQDIINNQLVKNSDILIGIFWTRLGSPTGEYASGTVEEIEEFIKANKPVMIYFSRKDYPSDIDIEQLKLLRDFKNKMQNRCLFCEYKDLVELKEQISRHVTMKINDIRGESNKIEVSAEPISPPNSKLISERVYFEDYLKNGKVSSFLVKGDTQNFKEELKKLGGKWNPICNGWFFPKKREYEIETALKEFL